MNFSNPSTPLEWIEHDAETQILLDRILRFTRWTRRDLKTNPVARNEVEHYLRVSRTIERRREVVDLEEQWNPLGRIK